MTTAAYAKSHDAWEEMFDQNSPGKSSFIQTVFGSCSGVVDAASVFFKPEQVCNRPYTHNMQNVRSRSRSRRSNSPSIRKSEEVMEIPEFLSTDMRDEYGARHSPTDDISALSSYTLDEMVKLQKIQALRTFGPGPPSPTTTEVSDDGFPTSDTLPRYEMALAPKSIKLVGKKTKKILKKRSSDRSVSEGSATSSGQQQISPMASV